MMQLVRSGSSWSGNERNCVFLNCPDATDRNGPSARFANVSAVSGLDLPDDGRAVAVVDWDHDGDLDLWLRNRNAPRLRLMRNRMNETSGNPRFVTVRLEGRSCNRDAIGARVELVLDGPGTDRRLVRSLVAGAAFLSQSSKWLHFGIEQGASILDLKVSWPDGKQETLGPVEVGQHYTVIQGTGRPVPWHRPSAAQLVARSSSPAATSAARIVLPHKIPFPSLTESTEDELKNQPSGDSKELRLSGDQPLLLMFWTSSCPNCRRELSDFSRHQELIRKAGLDVLALCLDGLDDAKGASSSNARDGNDFLQKIHFPFRTAHATLEAVERVRLFQNALFEKYPQFVVPLSFLLDADRNVVAIYRGSFSHDVIVSDIALTDENEDALRDLAIPLAGKWFTKLATGSEVAEFVGRRFQRRRPSVALRYFEIARQRTGDAQRRAKLSDMIAQIHITLANASQGEPIRAENHFAQAFALSPELAELHHHYGLFLFSLGQFDKAELHIREALRLRPDDPLAQKNLDLLNQRKQGE